MKNPRVVFAFVEAGMGHIMPEKSIADAFEKKYGAYATVVRSDFFSETGEEPLMRLEQNFVKEVKKYNRCAAYGFLNIWMMKLLGPRLLSKMAMEWYVPGAGRAALAHMADLRADMVVSTHWSTAYYAQKTVPRPINVNYVPDIHVIPLCRYPNDMTLVYTERGYRRALSRYPRRFQENNLRRVGYAIRKEAFDLPRDRRENRRALGLDENKFTIVMFEGGYGLGRMRRICRRLVKLDLPITAVAICGQNKKLYDFLSGIKTGPSLTLVVEGFSDKTLCYLAAADVFLGKSGAASVAEPTFFGVAEIITKYATEMEKDNATYYIRDVKNAIRLMDPVRAVKKIEQWLVDPSELHAMQENAARARDGYGSEETADVLWELLCKKFPELSGIKIPQTPKNGENETAP